MAIVIETGARARRAQTVSAIPTATSDSYAASTPATWRGAALSDGVRHRPIAGPR